MNFDARKRKKLAVAVSIMMIIALILTGTYAWVDYSQHKTNTFQNLDGKKYDVRLVEDFRPHDNWKTTDGDIKKQVRVMNVATSDEIGEVFVRLQLKEYMEIAEIKISYTDYRYAVGTDGKFIIFDYPNTPQGMEDAIEAKKNTDYKDFPIEEEDYYTDAITGQSGWFVKSEDKQIHGQYGKKVPYEIKQEDAKSLVNGVERASSEAVDNHQADNNGECLYTPHVWNTAGDKEDCGKKFHDYVQLAFGSDVISYSYWLENINAPIEKWIYDDTDETGGNGWVYWGMPLGAGDSTTNLLESVKLILQPKGPFYYTIHVDMEAVSLDELGKETPVWAGVGDSTKSGYDKAPAPLINAYAGRELRPVPTATQGNP